MATLPELEKAFIAADDAGNTEDATAFAAEIQRLRGSDAGLRAELIAKGPGRQAGAAPLQKSRNVYEPTTAEKLKDADIQGQFASMGARAGGPALGQYIGASTGPFAPVAVPALGFLGGVGGEAVAQAREGTGFRPGAMLGNGLMGAIPGAPLAAAGPQSLLRQGAIQGAGNLGAKAVETAIDQKRPLTKGEAAMALGSGMAAPAMAKPFDTSASVAAAALKKGNASARNLTYQRALDEGFVLDPSLSNPNPATRTAAGLAGTTALRERASQLNQETANAVVRRQLNIPEGTPLGKGTFILKRHEEAAPYREFSQLSPSAKDVLEEWGQMRYEAKMAWKDYGKSGDMKVRKAAEGFDKRAEKIEDFMISGAKKLGKPDLVDRLKSAKRAIARVHAADAATLESTGDISPSVLEAMWDNGTPLDGSLETVARLRQAMPSVMVPRPQVAPKTASVGQLARSAAGTGTVLGAPFQGTMAVPRYQGSPDLAASFARFGAKTLGRSSSGETPQRIPSFLQR